MSSKISISSNYSKMLQIFMDQSHRETFGKFLTPSYKLLSSNKDTGLSFDYQIPLHLCRLRNGKPTFSTSGAMAVFDQLSTYGLMAHDSIRPRGGVSVLLSTEVLKPSYPSDKVIVVSKCNKIGKSLGFCTMELHAADGTVLARGKHIKYLPLGTVWDIITHPYILPMTLALHDFTHDSLFFSRIRSTFTNIPHSNSKSFPECTAVGSVYEQLGLRVSDYALPPEMQAGGACEVVGPPRQTRVFELALQPHLVNNIGKMHGGAVASVVEEVCYLSQQQQGALAVDEDGKTDCSGSSSSSSTSETTSGRHVRAIEVRYQSAMEGDLVVTCSSSGDDQISGSCGMPSTSVGKILNKSSGMVCAEYICHWAATEQAASTACVGQSGEVL